MKWEEKMNREYRAEGLVKIPFNIIVRGRNLEEIQENAIEELTRKYDCDAENCRIDFVTEE